MTPETERKLAKVRKYSASLRRLFNFLAVLVGIGCLVSLLVLLSRSADNATLAIWQLEFTGEQMTPTLKVLASIYLLIIFAIALKLLRHLALLFGLYARGQIFTAENVRQIRQIGISVFLFCLSSLYSIFARLYLFAIDHPLPPSGPDQETVGLSFDASVMQILGGIIIIVISWIMDVGREMREEQDLTV